MMTMILPTQNLQQENSTLLMIRIMDSMAKEMKMTRLLNLKQKSKKPNLYDYSEAYILMTGDITTTGGKVGQ